MADLKNKLHNVLSHSVTQVLIGDIMMMLIFATLLYIIGETILPGSLSHFAMPYTVFMILFSAIFISIRFFKHNGKKFIFIPHSILWTICGYIIFFCMIMLANYRFGLILGSIMSALATFTLFTIVHTFKDLR